MSLKILKAGMLDSIQDLGRFGYQHIGINPTGAMDMYAAVIANSLAGNDLTEAVIEMHFPGPQILFEQPAIIAMSGGDFGATINGKSIPVNHPIVIEKNSTLQFQSLKNKTRCYLAVKGGFKLNKWLNSYSTNLKAEAGGLDGKKLAKDDVLEFNDKTDYGKLCGADDLKILSWQANEDYGNSSEELLVLPGAEWDWLDSTSKGKFLKNPFYISHNSDRMGNRLASEPLHTASKTELVSSAVNFGTIQLLPDGQLIILMADSQTTGGYPRIGNVISAQLTQLSQMKAGDKIHFVFTDHQIAESLMIKQQRHLLQLQIACKLRLENYIHEIRNENY